MLSRLGSDAGKVEASREARGDGSGVGVEVEVGEDVEVGEVGLDGVAIRDFRRGGDGTGCPSLSWKVILRGWGPLIGGGGGGGGSSSSGGEVEEEAVRIAD